MIWFSEKCLGILRTRHFKSVSVQFRHSVVSDSFVTAWIAARQASLSITNTRSSLKLMSIKSVMPSSHLILCRPLLLLPPALPASESFPMGQLFAWCGQSAGVSALASLLPKKSQGWSPSEWTGWISLQSKGLSRILQHHSSKASILWCSAFFTIQISHPHTWLLEKQLPWLDGPLLAK